MMNKITAAAATTATRAQSSGIIPFITTLTDQQVL